jgi:5-methylcytosine-specific restriction protein A
MPTINRLKKSPRKSNNSESRLERKKFYDTVRWRKLRKIKLMNNPCCEICFEHEIITPATQIHHRISFMNGKTEDEKSILFHDLDNLISICATCHGKLHAEKQKNNQ